jgi:hypothetical protein
MAIKLGSAYGIVTLDARGVREGVNNANAALKSLQASAQLASKQLQGIGKTMTLGLTLPLAALGTAWTKAASDYQETANKVKVVFGESADAVFAFAKDSATALGMSQQAALDAAGTFGNLFTSMGLAREASAEMSMGLVQLASDLASFNNLDPTEVLVKLRAGLVGEVEPMRTLGVRLDAVSVKAKAMAMGLADANGELSQAALLQARYAMMLEQTGNAQGDFARTADGLANQMRILKAQVEDAGVKLGTILLPYVLKGVTAITDLVEQIDSWDAATQQQILSLLALAAVVGPVIMSVGKMVAIYSALVPAVNTLTRAWQAGLTVQTSVRAAITTLTAGMNMLTVSILAAVAAVAALIAVWLTWKAQIADRVEAGMAKNMEVWADAMQKVVDAGGSAEDVLKRYVNGIEAVNQAHEKHGLVAELFVDKQQIILNGLEQTEQALIDASDGYAEYKSSVMSAADAAGLMIDAEGNLVRVIRGRGGVVTKVVEENFMLSESGYQAATAVETLTAAERRAETAARRHAGALKQVTNAAMDASDIMSIVSSTLSEWGMNADDASAKTDELAVSLGAVSGEAQQLQSDIRLITQAWAAGVLKGDVYAQMLQAAKDGTLKLSDAQRESYQSGIDQANLLKEQAASASEAASAYADMAMQLKDATSAQIASTLIGEIEKLKDAGAISPDQFLEAFKDIAIDFGLADEKSLALAEHIPLLTDALAKGVLPAQAMSEALGALITDAADGEVNFQAIIDKFGGIQTEAPKTTAVLQTEMPKWESQADKTAKTIAQKFSGINWEGVGSSIADGIAAGITAGTPAIVAAAEAAALAALDAANAALGIQSPSKEFMVSGKMTMLGMALGVTKNTATVIRSVRDMTQQMMAEAGGVVAGSGLLPTIRGGAVSLAPQRSGSGGQSFNEDNRTSFWAPTTIIMNSQDSMHDIVKKARRR